MPGNGERQQQEKNAHYGPFHLCTQVISVCKCQRTQSTAGKINRPRAFFHVCVIWIIGTSHGKPGLEVKRLTMIDKVVNDKKGTGGGPWEEDSVPAPGGCYGDMGC